MIDLIKAEIIKLNKNKSAFLLWGLFAALPIFQAWDFSVEVKNGKEINQAIETVIDGASSLLMLEKNSLLILMGIIAFMAFLVCDEFSQGTIRNVISLGVSRAKYYLAKLFIVFMVALIGCIIMVLVAMAAYTVAFGFGSGQYIVPFLVLLLLIFSCLSACFCISFLCKNAAKAIIWCIIYVFGTAFGPAVFPRLPLFNFITKCLTNTSLFSMDFAKAGWHQHFSFISIAGIVTILLTTILGIIYFKKTDIK